MTFKVTGIIIVLELMFLSINMFLALLGASGVARVIVWGGGASSERRRHSRGSAPQLLHGFRLLEWSGTQLGGGEGAVAPLNYATARSSF